MLQTPSPLRFRTIWISDIHLGTEGCQAERLLDFLAHTESEYLYLVGDIFDGWQLRKKWHWPASHHAVIEEFVRRARGGVKVVYIPGNHDEIARDYDGQTFADIPVMNDAIHMTADGKRLLMIHGDQYDGVMHIVKWIGHLGDAAYTGLLKINSFFNLFRRRMGVSYWSLSSFLKRKVKQAVEFISSFKKFIVDQAVRHDADIVVCGHIHHADIKMIGPILYCNDGDWVESCTALVEHANGKLEIIHWPSQREALLGPSQRETLLANTTTHSMTTVS
jgi:UDP-2,3-diacylglucosamine pyrophosphatase LpxH